MGVGVERTNSRDIDCIQETQDAAIDHFGRQMQLPRPWSIVLRGTLGESEDVS